MNLDALYERDKARCWLCRLHVPRFEASSDHLRPRSHGGYLKGANEALAHRTCNTARGNLPLDETVAILEEEVWPLPPHERKRAVQVSLRRAVKLYAKRMRPPKPKPRLPPQSPDHGGWVGEAYVHAVWCNLRWMTGFPSNDAVPLCTC